MNDIVGRGIGQHEQADQRYAESGVHYLAGAVAIRQDAAVSAEDTGRKREDGGQGTGQLHVNAIDPDQIFRQPERQRDEGTEHEEIVKRKTPDLFLFERLELLAQGFGLRAAQLARGKLRVVLRKQEENHRHHRGDRCPDLRDGLPAECHHHPRRGKFGYCGADIAHAEEAERGALLFRRIPLRHISHTHGEGTARDPEAKRRQQCKKIAVGEGKKICRDRRSDHRQRENNPSAILVGPYTKEKTRERSGQDRRADEQAELRIAEAEFAFDFNPNDRENRPDRETYRECDRAEPQGPILVTLASG